MATNASGTGDLPQNAQGPENPQASLQTVGDALASQVGEESLDAIIERATGVSAPETPPDQEAQAGTATDEGADLSQVSPEVETTEPEPGIPEGLQKRLDGLFARTKRAEEENARLKVEVEQLKARGGQPQPQSPSQPEPDPVEALPAVRELTSKEESKRNLLSQVRQWQRQLRRDPDAVVQAIQKAGVQLQSQDPDDVGDWLADAADRINLDLSEVRGQRTALVASERGKQDVARQHMDRVALERWPWLTDPASDQRKMADTILAARPWLKREAAFLPLLAMTTEFLLSLRQPQAGRAQAAPAAQTARPAPRVHPPGAPPAVVPGRVNGREAQLSAVDRQLVENPSEQNLEAYLEAANWV